MLEVFGAVHLSQKWNLLFESYIHSDELYYGACYRVSNGTLQFRRPPEQHTPAALTTFFFFCKYYIKV